MKLATYRAHDDTHVTVRKLARKLKVSKSEVIRTGVSLLALTHNL